MNIQAKNGARCQVTNTNAPTLNGIDTGPSPCPNTHPCVLITHYRDITMNGEPLDFVDDFTYLGSLIRKDNGAQKDIKARLGKAQGAFARLHPIWKSK